MSDDRRYQERRRRKSLLVCHYLHQELFSDDSTWARMSESSCRISALEIIQHSSDVTEYRVQSSAKWTDSATWAVMLLSIATITFVSVSPAGWFLEQKTVFRIWCTQLLGESQATDRSWSHCALAHLQRPFGLIWWVFVSSIEIPSSLKPSLL